MSITIEANIKSTYKSENASDANCFEIHIEIMNSSMSRAETKKTLKFRSEKKTTTWCRGFLFLFVHSQFSTSFKVLFPLEFHFKCFFFVWYRFSPFALIFHSQLYSIYRSLTQFNHRHCRYTMWNNFFCRIQNAIIWLAVSFFVVARALLCVGLLSFCSIFVCVLFLFFSLLRSTSSVWCMLLIHRKITW